MKQEREEIQGFTFHLGRLKGALSQGLATLSSRGRVKGPVTQAASERGPCRCGLRGPTSAGPRPPAPSARARSRAQLALPLVPPAPGPYPDPRTCRCRFHKIIITGDECERFPRVRPRLRRSRKDHVQK